MLEDAAGIRRVVLACGRVDLRKSIYTFTNVYRAAGKQHLADVGSILKHGIPP